MHPLPNVAPIKFDFSKLSLLHGCIRSVWHKNCDNCDHSVAASKLTITEVEKNSEDKIGSHRNFTHLSWTLKAHDFRIFKFQQEIYLPAICGWLPSWLSRFIRKTKSTKLPAWGTKAESAWCRTKLIMEYIRSMRKSPEAYLHARYYTWSLQSREQNGADAFHNQNLFDVWWLQCHCNHLIIFFNVKRHMSLRSCI